MELPSEFFGDRPVVYPVRVLERRMLWQEGRPREHVLVCWSDGSDSPTWEPLDVINRRFPNVLLEEKDVAIEGGVDTVPQSQSARTAEPKEAEITEQSIAKSKPKRNVKPPNKLGDFVPK